MKIERLFNVGEVSGGLTEALESAGTHLPRCGYTPGTGEHLLLMNAGTPLSRSLFECIRVMNPETGLIMRACHDTDAGDWPAGTLVFRCTVDIHAES